MRPLLQSAALTIAACVTTWAWIPHLPGGAIALLILGWAAVVAVPLYRDAAAAPDWLCLDCGRDTRDNDHATVRCPSCFWDRHDDGGEGASGEVHTP